MRTYVVVIVTFIFIAFLGFTGFIFVNSFHFTPDKSFHRGKKEYEIGNYAEAINYLNDYLSLNKRTDKTAPAQFYIALSLKELGKSEEAKKRLALLINPRGDEHLLVKDYETYRAKAVIEYADICRLENHYEQYIIAQIELMLKMPNDPEIERQLRTQYGYQMLLMGNRKEALNFFLTSNTELALLGKARAYWDMNEADNAFAVYEEFMRYNNDSKYLKSVEHTYRIQAFGYALRLYEAGSYLASVPYFQKIVSAFPANDEAEQSLFYIAEAYYTVAKKAYDAGRTHESDAYFTKAIDAYNRTRANRITTLDDAALVKSGMAYYWLKKYAAAYNAMDTFLNDYPDSKYATSAHRWREQAKKDLEYMN